MIDKIRMNGMRFHGYHGVMQIEKDEGQTFEVDVEIEADFKSAISSDDVKDTVDYDAVHAHVERIVCGERYNLLETLGDAIGHSLINQFNIDKVVVRVRKPDSPVNWMVGSLEVEIKREKI